MNNLAQNFHNELRHISALPFDQQEAVCNSLQFLLEDYVKKFASASIKTYQILFSALRDIAGFYSSDKTVLEIGPGFNLGVLFLAALGGARKAIGVDCFTHDMGPEHDFIMSMYSSIMKDPTVPIINDNLWNTERLTDEFAKIIQKDNYGKYAFKKDRIEFLHPYSADKLPVPDSSIDLVITSAAFEHFLNPADVVKELFRISSRGGISCHAIDMRDHRDFTKPLEFLTINENEWDEINRRSLGYSSTNRLRPKQIISLFNSAGFDLDGVKPLISLRPDSELSSRFVEPFKSMPENELFTLVQIFIFRKAR